LEKAIDLSCGDVTEDSIRQRAMAGDTLIIIVSNGADIVSVSTIEVYTYDSGKKSMLIPMVGGEGIREWGQEWIDFISQIARDVGCDELRGMAARDGWLGLLKGRGWIQNHVIITKRLGE
jgi:hypothetical protein